MTTEATIATLLNKVGADPEAAVQLLVIAGECLELRKPMPDALADHLAKTFKLVAAVHRDERAGELAQLLGLAVVGASRKPISVFEVAKLVAEGDGASETSLKKSLAKAQGVSASTALKHVKKAKEAQSLTRKLTASAGALVRRRTR